MLLRVLAALGLSLLLLCGCGAGSSKQDILAKAKDCTTREELRKALGKPDAFDSAEIPLLGAQEIWKYKASDGEVTFTISNGKILTRATDFGSTKK